MSLDERLDKAEEMIQKPSFRENKGLGNEVGYYIFDYPAEKELYIRERIEYIKKKSENSDDDFKVVVFDLYDIMIDILIKKGYLEKCYQFEKTKGFERVSKSISNMLRITSSDSLIVNYIRDNTPEKAVVFITGIGKRGFRRGSLTHPVRGQLRLDATRMIRQRQEQVLNAIHPARL